ncbi:hypothetical protein BDW22DRAFT_1346504 [Trametopsis cervina]|nr:hypothetical protein BDW22DRAFT_1346504 [Trametopsis cervina]
MDALSTTTLRVTLSPTAGFCIKSSALQPAICAVTNASAAPGKGNEIIADNTLTIARGQKVFVNVAWDANVPPPPDASNEVIRKAMAGEQHDGEGVIGEGREGAWFVPVIVSEPRRDVDKAGKPSAVFDCLYNSSLKSRTLREPEFRAFLVELGLQRIEAQYGLVLSRQLGTPNIASKGKLHPRTALVPLRLYPAAHPLRQESAKQKASLIQELSPSVPIPAKSNVAATAADASKPKSILKPTPGIVQKTTEQITTTLLTDLDEEYRPRFEWTKEGERIKITVHAPNVTRAQVEDATLDIEPRRMILHVPGSPRYALDVDLSVSDAQLMATFGGTSTEDSALMLKRQRDFDVEGAQAEWNVQEGTLVVYM